MKPVAIDTEDENGGVARTSFLYVEVEADQTITVEPEVCPDGTIPPTRVYEMNYAVDNAHCPESWENEYGSSTFDCEYEEEVPDDYDVFLDNPAKYICVKVPRHIPIPGTPTRTRMSNARYTQTIGPITCAARPTSPR
jgi:hypothetical protein